MKADSTNPGGWTTHSNVFVSGDYMYFREPNNNKVRRVKTDGTDCSNPGGHTTLSNVFVSGDYMYFRGTDNKVWRVTTDGKVSHDYDGRLTTLSDVFVSGDYMYFRDTNDNKVRRVKTDGTDSTNLDPWKTHSNVFVSGDYMYFRGTNNKVWRVKTDGTDRSGRNPDGHKTSSDVFVSGDYMYFRGTVEGKPDDNKVWRVKTDGTDSSNPGGHKTLSNVFVSGDYMYFRGTDNKVWRVTTDGSSSTYLGPFQTQSDVFVSGGYMYFRGYDEPKYAQPYDNKVRRVKTDAEQSPIELRGALRADDSAKRWLLINWKATLSGTVQSGPHGVEVVFTDPDRGGITLGGKVFQLEKFHLHHPAEHPIEGRLAPVELHIIHSNPDGTLAVVGITFDKQAEGLPLGEESRFFVNLIDRLTGEGKQDLPISTNPNYLLPANKDRYYRYEGSLTTPPFSENVSWVVLADPTGIEEEVIKDLEDHEKSFSQHARPVHPLNRRLLLRNF